jgi:hypothetical protein
MRPSTAVPTALNRAGSSLAVLLGLCRRLLGVARSGIHRLHTRAGTTLRGPVARTVRGPFATLVVGRRTAVSVILTGLAPVLAALTAGAIATTTGHPPLERWLVETWTGTDPHPVVFAGAAFLVGLAAASAAAKAGLVPTSVLVAAPVFGVAVTRYGTAVSTHAGERVVSLPDAVAVATGVAVVGSVATVAVGYPLGAACRRAVRLVRADVHDASGGM